MSPLSKRSVTLIELLIAIVLLSIITIGFSSIDLFSRYHVLSSERRAKLQNDVSYALEHISKNIGRAIGNIPTDLINSDATITDIIDARSCGVDPTIKIFIDANPNGRRDGNDHRVAYRLYLSDQSYQLWYDQLHNTGLCSEFTQDELIASRITSFIPLVLTDAGSNYINVVQLEVTACWDPDGNPHACGTPDNPSVTMRTRIKMPSVSTN